MKTKKSPRHAEKCGPHLVKLPEGALPDYIELTKYQVFCWRTMGKAVKLRAKPNPKLELHLLQAHMRMRPEEYVAYVWMSHPPGLRDRSGRSLAVRRGAASACCTSQPHWS